MGQKLGRSIYPISVVPFCGLSRRSIATIWQTFNDIASGFGITYDECGEICVDLFSEMNVSREAVREMAIEVFKLFDTDKNDLIDALEFIGTIAVISGMRAHEILEFLLKMYDFDGKVMLSLDELTLALRSIACGLCKLVGQTDFPREEVIEELTTKIFYEEVPTLDDMTRLRITMLVEKLSIHPDVCSWYAYYGNPPIQVPDLLKFIPDVVSLSKPAILGDAIKLAPWQNNTTLLLPIKYASVPPGDIMPNASLEATWVYGYQSEACTSNVYYNNEGDILYNISRYVIIYNAVNNRQKIFTGHSSEVSALGMHPAREIAATGERTVAGTKPRIIVWNSRSFSILMSEVIPSGDEVKSISFSNDGQLVAAMCKSFSFDTYVYHWESRQTIFSCSVNHRVCYAVSFLKDNSIVIGGTNFFHFWCNTSEGYVHRVGIFSRHTSSQTVTCIAQCPVNDQVITGTMAGYLLLWTDRNCLRYVKGHEGQIITIFSCEHGLITGGKDFRIRLWTMSLDPGATFDISSFSPCPEIRALCLSGDGTSIAIGCKNSQVFEISAIDGSDLRGGAMTNGHGKGKICCICPHPSKMEVATVCDDCNLLIWDITSKLLLRQAKFENPVTSVCYNPLGDLITVGMGGAPNKPITGMYVCLNEEDLTKVHEARDSTYPVSVMKYSPDGETLAVACDDGGIFLYAVSDEYELIGRCVRHVARVTHLDYSVDGEWLRSNSVDGELFFFNTDDATFQSNISSLRDIEWASFSCAYSWHTKDVHTALIPGEIVTTLHAPTPQSDFLVCASSHGYVKVHPLPCAQETLPCQRYPAHVGSITYARFCFDGSFLFTAGESDNCWIQWRTVTFKPLNEEGLNDDAESEDFGYEAFGDSDIEDEAMEEAVDVPDAMIVSDLAATTLDPDCDVWQELVVAPNNIPNQNKEVPPVTLRLEYVHGVHSQDMRNMVAYNKISEVVFVAASYGVVMNRKNRSQRYYEGHTDRITCFSINKEGTIAATGQVGRRPLVNIWSTESCETLACIPMTNCRSISAVALSNSGRYVAIASLNAYHSIQTYEWKTGLMLSDINVGRRRMLNLAFSDEECNLCSIGVREITLWTNVLTQQPKSVKPELGEIGQVQVFLCARYFAGKLTVGTSDGYLYVFNETMITHAVKAHNGKVYCLDVSTNGKQLVSGGKDGAVRIWNKKLECVKEIQIESILPCHSPKVRSVRFSSNDGNILVCTRGAEIFEVILTSTTLSGGKPLLSSHGTRELWGLATHPTKEEFITAGDDCSIRIWDANNYQLLKIVRVDTPTRSVCYSPDGRQIAVGFGSGKRIKGRPMPKEGAFAIMSTGEYNLVHEGKDSSESIRVVKFTPDGLHLMAGSDDGNIYMYQVKKEYALKLVFNCHKASVRSIDFSSDGNFMMSVDSTTRFKFSEVLSGKEVPNPAVFRDEKWGTWTSPVGWQIQGMWMNRLPKETVTSAQRSLGKTLMAGGTNFGRLAVSHSPCYGRAASTHARGHAGQISNMSWLAGDGRIITTGQKDHSIFQWKVEYDGSRESGDEGGLSCDDSIIDKDGGKFIGICRRKNKGEFAEKKWIQSISPPSNFVDKPHTSVQCLVEGEFSHGARLSDSRQTLLYNFDGDVIFAAGALCVVLYRAVYTFQHYTGHSNAVISMALDCTGQLVASGELAEYPEIHIWNSRTRGNVCVLQKMHRGGVTCISFSNTNEHLVSLGQDPLNGIVVYRSANRFWNDAVVLYSTPVSVSKLLWVTYVAGNEFPVVAGGKKVIFFIRKSTKTAERIKGIFGKRFIIQPLLCVAEGHDRAGGKLIVTGTVSGHLYAWADNRVVRGVSAHDAPCNAVAKVWFGFVSGGKEGGVKVWNQDFKLLHSYNLKTFSPAPCLASCHALRINRKGTKCLIGMRSGEVYEISLSTHSSILLTESHSRRQIHGLDVNPNNPDEYVTGGDDGVLRFWSILSKRCVRRLSLECAIRTIAWSPTKTQLIVGVGGDPSQAVKDGAIIVINTITLEIDFEDRKAKKFVSDIKYSPSGSKFCYCSADGRAYIHDSDSYQMIKMIEPTKLISCTSIDFSADEGYVRFATVEEDLYVFSMQENEFISSPMTTRDVIWATFNVPYTWETQGIWTPGGPKVVSTTLKSELKLIATTYDDGSCRIHNFPCMDAQDPFMEVKGIATQGGRIRFSANGAYLVILDSYCRNVFTASVTVPKRK